MIADMAPTIGAAAAIQSGAALIAPLTRPANSATPPTTSKSAASTYPHTRPPPHHAAANPPHHALAAAIARTTATCASDHASVPPASKNLGPSLRDTSVVRNITVTTTAA